MLGPLQSCCRTPQQALSAAQLSTAVPLKKKEVDDVLGGEDAWKNVAKTNGAPHACPAVQ